MIERKEYLSVMALVLGFLFTLFFLWQSNKQEILQKGIADEVIRFHVLANSDEEEDQKLKMKVRDTVLTYLEKVLAECENVDETRAAIINHLEKIETYTEIFVLSQGYLYSVNAELVKDFFPEKTYGDFTFPEGEYEALRISLGEGNGHNWWCMVYPGLCFTEECGAYVSTESEERLKHVLTEDEYNLIQGENIKIRFKWLNLEKFGLF